MRLPKDRHTGRVDIEPDTTNDNSLTANGTHPSIQHSYNWNCNSDAKIHYFSVSGGLSKLRATSSRSERGRDRHAAAAAQVQARRLRQAEGNEEQRQPHRTRSGPAATLKELQQMAELYEAGDQPLLALVSLTPYHSTKHRGGMLACLPV